MLPALRQPVAFRKMQPGNAECSSQFMVLMQCNAVGVLPIDLFQQCAELRLRRAGLAYMQARQAMPEEPVDDTGFSGQHFGMGDDDKLFHLQINFTALFGKFACLLLHALVKRRFRSQSVFLRVVAHILGDLHRAEVWSAHRAEMGYLGAFGR